MSESASPETADKAPGLRHRILQSRGRRYSLKLEPEFWTWLEGLAASRGVRLNVLVAELAENLPAGASLASGLRQYCLMEAGQRIMRLEDRVLELSLASGFTNLSTLVEACPAPSILISNRHEIVKVNGAVARWMGVSRGDLVGRRFDHVFNLATAAPLAEVWKEFGLGYARPVPAKLTYLAPGRVVVAKASLCAASVRGPDDFSYLVMIDVTW